MFQLRRAIARMLRSIRGDLLLAVLAPRMATAWERTRHLVQMIVVTLVHKCKPAAPGPMTLSAQYRGYPQAPHSLATVYLYGQLCHLQLCPDRILLLRHIQTLDQGTRNLWKVTFVNRLSQGLIRKDIRERLAFLRSAMHNGQNTGNRRSLILAQTCPVIQDIHNQCWHGSR